MNRLSHWLKQEVFGLKLLKLLGMFMSLKIAYLGIVVLIYRYLTISPQRKDVGIKIISIELPVILLMSVIVEEIAFRLLPLLFAQEVLKLQLPGVLVVATISSVLFGWSHGSLSNIPIQGVAGIMYCVLFLKTAGLRKNYVKGLATTITTHYLFNISLAVIIFCQGARQI